MAIEGTYDIIVAGTGFASTFFVHKALAHLPADARVLFLERGRNISHAERLSSRGRKRPESDMYENATEMNKRWRFNISVGGGSNCWWACTPRMHPEDFELRSKYKVAVDWPVKYDALEEFYCEAEDLMEIAGPQDGSPFPRSRPYPQAPHRLTDPDKLLKQATPDQFFSMPCARPSGPTRTGRAVCCASGVCDLCPVDSKFTILNGMGPVFEDPRVTLQIGATVLAVDVEGGTATGVTYREASGREQHVKGNLIVLGCNAMFNPLILKRSGLDGPQVGKGLVEQVSISGNVLFDGVKNFQGSTSITGHGYWLYNGRHRARHAGALVETWNVPRLRDLRGRWRERLWFKVIFEDLRQPFNEVVPSETDPEKPRAIFKRRSNYAESGIRSAHARLKRVFSKLPIDEFNLGTRPAASEEHILGTTVMGDDPAKSVVDKHMLHHKVRNLVVAGSGAFPTAAPANPSLTIATLSLWSADKLFRRSGT